MIVIPIKWRTPKIMNSCGIKIHVTKVTISPNENILIPRLKYLLNKPPTSYSPDISALDTAEC